MLGQGVIPRTIDPLVSATPVSETSHKLALLHQAMHQYSNGLPRHEDVLQQYCTPSKG
jgi:hypothetical protein